jgi:hypothetical protein
MVSTVKVTNIDTPDNTGNITFDRPIVGDGSSLTSLPAANLTGTLPAIDGSNLTSVPAGQVKVGTFSRIATTGSGTQVITGVGFQPVAVLLSCSMAVSPFASFSGYDDATTAECITDYSSTSSNTYLPSGHHSVDCRIASGNTQMGKISSMDSNGFTFSWTLSGAGHGYTMTVNYIALR